MDDKLPKLTVSEITMLIKNTLESSFYNVIVEGEISGFKRASTGHWYFSLKDQNALLSACMWKSSIYKVPFVPKDGQKVVVIGNISVYEPRGTYQIVCSSIKLAGEGDLLAMLEERKRYYQNLGYFDQDRKKAIPKRPNRVAIITSPTGAALQDILQITKRRNPGLDLIILPAVVQGSEAAETIAKRIQEVNDFLLADVMIVGRGGGSIEDLLPFSEDCVIQAIYNSSIPVISAVGHEVDFSISDFVADLRAPTPSAAAELVCESSIEQIEKISKLKMSMTDSIINRVNTIKLRLSAFSSENAKAKLENKLSKYKMSLDTLVNDMEYSIKSLLNAKKAKSEVLKGRLIALSPLSVLDRGFSLVTDKNGKVVKNANDLVIGSDIEIRMASGEIKAQVKEVKHG